MEIVNLTQEVEFVSGRFVSLPKATNNLPTVSHPPFQIVKTDTALLIGVYW